MPHHLSTLSFFFFNDTATTEIYTLSLHDALPISHRAARPRPQRAGRLEPQHRAGAHQRLRDPAAAPGRAGDRSEEHTSELQSLTNLVCRLLLEKKKTNTHQSLPERYQQLQLRHGN